MPDRPKISVLVPTYQYARYLSEALDSVLAQDCADFELMISDDASNDGSAEIIQAYARRDPRIRFKIHEKNIGMVANWNWCLREAKGDYVKFLFGDDSLPSPRALGRMAAMLEAEPRAVLAVTARVILDENSRQTDVWAELGAPGYQPGHGVIARCLQQDRNLVGEPSVVMFRRAAAARGFDPTFRQLVDQEMWFHLLSAGDLVYDPEPMCAFRCHSAQQTVVNSRDHVASGECMRIVSRYFDYFAGAEGFRPGSFAMHRRLFRYIYYTRKDSADSPTVAAAAATLLPWLSRRSYFFHWCLHRVIKPFENIHRRCFGKPPVGQASIAGAGFRPPAVVAVPPRPGPTA